mmetsp:Transcript_18236/g.42768  ORF Transcript_18236/g.42768 Transcript_18236/m.42768 type:complete len:102 (+) Transcript_18236:1906-2211(+)
MKGTWMFTNTTMPPLDKDVVEFNEFARQTRWIQSSTIPSLRSRSTFWLFLGTATAAVHNAISTQQLEDLWMHRWKMEGKNERISAITGSSVLTSCAVALLL